LDDEAQIAKRRNIGHIHLADDEAVGGFTRRHRGSRCGLFVLVHRERDDPLLCHASELQRETGDPISGLASGSTSWPRGVRGDVDAA
jgi:hypothetical protein